MLTAYGFLFCLECGYAWKPRKDAPVECPACKKRNCIPSPGFLTAGLRGEQERAEYPAYKRGQEIISKAYAAVGKAVKRGLLPKLDGSIACVDCGAPAVNYDHRDYFKHLQVEPVCCRCNKRRGPGNRNPGLSQKEETTP